MTQEILIGLIGDRQPDVTAHRAIPIALQIAAVEQKLNVSHQWLETSEVQDKLSAPDAPAYNGLWCVPASPYIDTDGALFAINKGRNRQIPFLGTCGGYQHMLLEFAHNELGLTRAANAEITPDAEMPLIAPLSCSMVEVTDRINFKPGSLIARHYKKESTDEKYHCNFGLNANFANLFANTDLQITGADKNQQPRAIELKNHPFYIGVAFQPERTALENHSHPLISAFLQAAASHQQPLST